MAHELFDLSRIRRNWERTEPGMEDPAPDRLRHVRPPLDPFVVAGPLLDRLRREIDAEYPEQRVTLAPFIARVERLYLTMAERARTRGGTDTPATPVTPDDAGELRDRFVAALNDLEDLCEALLHLKR